MNNKIKQLGLTFTAGAFTLILCACNPSKTKVLQDSIAYEPMEVSSKTSLYQEWLNDYQEKNPQWYKTEKDKRAFVKAFEKNIVSNIDFAKSVCDDNRSKIVNKEYISGNDEGDKLYAFEYKVKFYLPVPIPDGSAEGVSCISMRYGIMSLIPRNVSTEYPYTGDANYAERFDKHVPDRWKLEMGTYFVGNKVD